MSVPVDELTTSPRHAAPGSEAASASASSWARSRERSNALAMRVMAWFAVICGRRVARLVLHPITAYFLVAAPAQRRNVTRYLRRALGREPVLADHYRHVHNFASIVLDRIYLLRDRLDLFDIRHTGEDLVLQTAEQGRGAFLIGAHIGSFEALHATGRHDPHRRVAMVMYPDNARLINGVLAAIAPEAQLKVIALGRPETPLAIRDWLDGGGLAGILADRTPPGETQRKDVHRLDFLGTPADFSDGPFRLAMLLRRRMFFMVGLYLGGNRYDIRIEPLADFRVKAATPGERERSVQLALQAYVERLESLCREAPGNWFNFHDYWHDEAH